LLLAQDERPRCAAAECDGQLKFWKRNARPVFEGQWACGETCLQDVILRSVRRWSTVASSTRVKNEHRHRVPLGLVLLDRGLVTQFQIQQALEAQRAAGHGRTGYWLQAACGVSAETVARGLAAQWSRPVLSGTALVPSIMANVLPSALREAFGLVPLRVAGGQVLYAGFKDSINASAVHALEHMSGLRVETGLLLDADYAATHRELAARQRTMTHEETVACVAQLPSAIASTLGRFQPVASRLACAQGTWWLRLWLERGALAPHGAIPSTGEDVVDVLFRVVEASV